ncbi:MAG: GIY-YIG nuclease family protein [Bdellovibrionales bacterium]|nr:GIY-YIG nuclease family protein [Bdellovibrionales bacterium]
MKNKNVFFPHKTQSNPKIYAYEDLNPQYKGLLKIGFTASDVQKRVGQQYPTKRPGSLPYKIVLEASAMRNDGSSFTDHDVHRLLRKKGIYNPDGEWFQCTVKQVQGVILSLQRGSSVDLERTQTFGMRPEQCEAVDKTMIYFKSYRKENPDKTPHFLWNAKMRFGKTFATYQLAKKMGWKRILVLTFKPAVQSAWEDDLQSHVDFKGWQFISRGGLTIDEADPKKPFVCFGSFQDFLGKNKVGGIKPKNEWVHTINWDCVVFDEYHFGAWRENAKELFEKNPEDQRSYEEQMEILKEDGSQQIAFDEDVLPITTNHYLYLSGTPFRAIETGEFIEEQIYNWTYSDEQKAKLNWKGNSNPYESLPRMVLMTYQLPDYIRKVALGGEFDAFDLNTFFSAQGRGEFATFDHENEVQKWLDLIRGSLAQETVSALKQKNKKAYFPFSHTTLLNVLSHTLWFLPSVASCYAMRNLLLQKQNRFYHDYQVIVAASSEAGSGVRALEPVQNAMGNPLETKTITLSCGKLTTGVSVKPWTGIFMLRNLSTPETYFQAAFRVQTPWVIKNPDGKSPNQEEIIKKECYVFDFAPDRALRQISDYSSRLSVNESNPERRVEEFIDFLPVLAYENGEMIQINAAGILEKIASGTTATLLAKRWESALLVNVDNQTLDRLMKNKDAMDALMKIEGFRTLNQDIETIINQSNAVKEMKKKANEKDLSAKDKKVMTEKEKEFKSLRKQIQDKLIKFATRIPVFMYLTDYREMCLRDVITQLEPSLFKKVTGLEIKEFQLIVSLGVFNSALMNDAVYKFKRYEDSSLKYTGITRHKDHNVGLYDTVITAQEFKDSAQS